MKVIIFPQKDHDDFENKGYLVSGISSVDWKSILDQCTYGSRGSVCQRSGKTHWKKIAFAFQWSRSTQNTKVVQSQLSILIDKKRNWFNQFVLVLFIDFVFNRFVCLAQSLLHYVWTWVQNSTSSVLVYYRVTVPEWNLSHIQSSQICYHHHWCRAPIKPSLWRLNSLRLSGVHR